MNLPIRWKITLATLLALLCGFIIAGMLAARSLERQELAQSNRMLEVRTNLVAHALQPLFRVAHPAPSSADIHSIVRELASNALARITLVAADGSVLADSAVSERDLPNVENHRTRPEIEQAIASGYGTDLRASHTTGQRTLYRAVRLNRGPANAPAVYLRLGLPVTALDQELATLNQNLLLAFGTAFLAMVGLSIWLARSLTKPLSDMAAAARRLTAGDHAVRIRTTALDEVGLLGNTLNQMTDRLQATIAEISEDRSQLFAVLTSMVEGVLVLDHRGRILQINPALERMFKVTRAEARGRPAAEVFSYPQLHTLVSTTLETRTDHEDELVLAPSGRCLHVEASIIGGEREHDAGAVLVFHDMTELRRLEQIRKDFVANVSHELRTPLTSIKGYVEALVDGGKDDPETCNRFLDIIMKQSDRLNFILDDLLQLSKIESGQVLFKREPLHIAAMIERTLSMMRPLAEKKGHQLIVQLSPHLPLILGDEERLAQVLSNLLDNAIKYTPERGIITVSASPTTDGQTDNIDLSVTDSGIGIPEQDRPRIFERFYRVDKARSRELGGTGLGLAIVKHIVEAHGGHVWVEGQHPTGSRFIVRIPIQPTGQPAQPSLVPSR